MYNCSPSPYTPLRSTCDAPYMEDGKVGVFKSEVPGEFGGSGDMISEWRVVKFEHI